MPDETRHESQDLEDYEVLDSSDTLDGAPGDDPLDRGVVAPDRWSAGIRYGTTTEEEQQGESIDGLLLDDGPDPRAGRLVAEDEGAHADEEADLVASDVGPDAGGATAEEAAVHVVEEDDYDIRSE